MQPHVTKGRKFYQRGENNFEMWAVRRPAGKHPERPKSFGRSHSGHFYRIAFPEKSPSIELAARRPLPLINRLILATRIASVAQW